MKRWATTFLLLLGWLAVSPLGMGQTAPGDLLVPAGSDQDPGLGLGARKLASGVMTLVPSSQTPEDTSLGPFDLDFVAKHPELEWTAPDFPDNQPFFASPAETLLSQSRGVTLRHPVWGLEFAFKPARLIEVDIPNETGKMERKTVWYLIYRVRYAGEDLLPDTPDFADSEAVPGEPKRVRFESVRFIPRFTLLSKERNLVMDSQILAPAVAAIAAKERVQGPLLDHVEIARNEIKLSTREDENSVWGVATWTDVDPALNFFAIDVRGLTNAYQINVDSGGEKRFYRKTLRIYFWRPGDSFNVPKDRVYLGSPAYEDPKRVQYYLDQFSLKERLDYQWIYR
ncbi:MAG: hypothetical protein ACK553_11815 [Planctomycetota bacterium]